MTRSLTDFKANPKSTYGRCKRCRRDFNGGPRGMVQIGLFRKPGGGPGQESLGHYSQTMCESCTLEVWDQVEAALYSEPST